MQELIEHLRVQPADWDAHLVLGDALYDKGETNAANLHWSIGRKRGERLNRQEVAGLFMRSSFFSMVHPSRKFLDRRPATTRTIKEVYVVAETGLASSHVLFELGQWHDWYEEFSWDQFWLGSWHQLVGVLAQRIQRQLGGISVSVGGENGFEVGMPDGSRIRF